MNTDTFTETAEAAGFTEFVDRELTDALGPEPHTHDFDARLLVRSGSITLTIGDQVTTYTAGQMCEVPRGTVHAEAVGPDGAHLLIARRSN